MTYFEAINRLAKWRSVLAGWQLGTQAIDATGVAAVRDHREATLIIRAELNALTSLLIRKGVITEPEFHAAMEREAGALEREMQQRFPGFRATDDGIAMDPIVALATMREKGFPQ